MSEYYAVVRSTDHLAHYGVKGMKWGVRKAIAKGDTRALDRHFRRAVRKLAKLQDKGLNSKKYAAKAAGYGAAAAGVGTLAVAFPKKKSSSTAISNASRSINNQKLYSSLRNAEQFPGIKRKVSSAIAERKLLGKKGPLNNMMNTVRNSGGNNINDINSAYNKSMSDVRARNRSTNHKIAAGVLAAGLGGLAARNAYVASHGAKYRKQAVDFKNAMDDAFYGTKYHGQYIKAPKTSKKKRR